MPSLSPAWALPRLWNFTFFFDEVRKILEEKKIRIHKSYVGNYFTSLDMMGATLTVMKLDDELKTLIDLPVYTMGMKEKQGNPA